MGFVASRASCTCAHAPQSIVPLRFILQVCKIGEGTFGEAFKSKSCVLKIVPMEGDMKVRVTHSRCVIKSR